MKPDPIHPLLTAERQASILTLPIEEVKNLFPRHYEGKPMWLPEGVTVDATRIRAFIGQPLSKQPIKVLKVSTGYRGIHRRVNIEADNSWRKKLIEKLSECLHDHDRREAHDKTERERLQALHQQKASRNEAVMTAVNHSMPSACSWHLAISAPGIKKGVGIGFATTRDKRATAARRRKTAAAVLFKNGSQILVKGGKGDTIRGRDDKITSPAYRPGKTKTPTNREP